MKAIILAAGRGKRLKPLTDTLPKTLLEINGKTILERAIDTLRGCGVKEILLVVGYRAEQVKKAVDKYNDINIQVIHNKDYATTDNMYSVMLCKESCVDESILIMNGDLIVSKDILQESVNAKFSNMPIEMKTNLKDGQKVLIKDDKIKAIGKTLSGADGTSINVVKFSKEDARIYFDNIERIIKHENRPNEWFEVAINETLDSVDVRPIEIKKGFWIEVDDYKDFEKANEMLKKLRGV